MRLDIKQENDIEQKLIDIRKFRGGSNLLVDEARAKKHYATQVINMWQVQDGLWETRPGTKVYGEAISGESSIDGAASYIKSDGTKQLIAIAGGTAYYSEDGGSWSSISGATFTSGETCYFIQIGGYLYITNGTDDLTRYDGSSLSTYSSLSNPSWAGTPLARGAGLSSGSYTLYYQVTAINDVGETAAAAEESIAVDMQRDEWSETDEYITLDWDSVTGANRYNIYYSDESGDEVWIGTTTATTFEDDGSTTPNPYLETPDDNTTSAPKFKQMELSGNRLWATNDPDNEYRVYFSGTGQHMGYFSPFYGGGWIDLEKGGTDKPKAVAHYRTGKGESIPTILCSSPNGTGSIWQVKLTSTSVGDVTFSLPSAYKIVGSIGSSAPYSVVKAKDNIFFANKTGIFALRNKEQMFQVLSTDEMSVPIRPEWLNLQGGSIDGVAGFYKDGRVYFSVPWGDSDNNRICIFDLERNNWTWSWDIGFKQFLEYTDSNGDTHFLGVPYSENKIKEITDSVFGDEGSPFYQSYISPLIQVDKDRTNVLKLREAVLELNRPRGSIDFTIMGIQKKQGFKSLGSVSVTDEGAQSGVSWDGWSEMTFSDTSGTPSTYTQATVKKAIKLNEKVYNVQFQVSSSSAQTKYTILGLQAKGFLIPSRTPSSWRN
jgi:hypothetical protein